MLIDELKIHLKAGDGGNGVVRWRHEKGKELAGPGGGNGGKGGDVLPERFATLVVCCVIATSKNFRLAEAATVKILAGTARMAKICSWNCRLVRC